MKGVSKVVAIFGAGRIGKVHFHNCFLNDRIVIKYIVESVLDSAVALLRKYRVEDQVKPLDFEDANKVYGDSE